MSSYAQLIAIISLYLCSPAHAHADELGSRATILQAGGFLGGGLADWVGKDADGSLPGVERVPRPVFAMGLLAILDLSILLDLGTEPFHFGVQPEVVYSTKGARVARDGEVRGASTKMTYLQAGILARAEYHLSERVTPYFLMGPELGFLHQVEFRNGLGDVLDTKDSYRSTDIGLILGLGALYSFPPWGAASLELRADLGFVSILDNDYGNEVRNAALLLLLGYLY